MVLDREERTPSSVEKDFVLNQNRGRSSILIIMITFGQCPDPHTEFSQ